MSTVIIYGEDFRYGIDNPVGAPVLPEVANVGNPISSAVHLKIYFNKLYLHVLHAQHRLLILVVS